MGQQADVDDSQEHLAWRPVVLGPRPEMPPPEPADVHVWRLDLHDPAISVAAATALLDPREQAQAHRFRFDADRRRYVLSHGLLRRVLAGYLDMPAQAIRYRLGPRGKPYLDGGDAAVRFNLTHSASVALCAVAWDRDVGIDVEQVRPGRNSAGIAEHYFSPAEVSALRALSPAQREQAFYACWTRKEAYLKARGDGLSLRLDSFDVSLDPAGPATLLRSDHGAGEVDRWHLRAFTPAAGYTAAVAVEDPPCRLRGFATAGRPPDGQTP